MRSLLLFSALAIAHFVLSFVSLFVGGGVIMAAFDGEGSTMSASIAALVMTILIFPVVDPLPSLLGIRGLSTAAQYALFILNSMLWSAIAVSTWAWWRRRRRALVGA